MKKLAKDYAGEFTCSRENTEKKKKSFPIFKEVEAISKNGGQTTKATL